MNKYIKQWCFAVFMLSLSSVALAAPKGICTPDNGVFHSTLDFSGYLDWPPESPDNQYHLNK